MSTAQLRFLRPYAPWIVRRNQNEDRGAIHVINECRLRDETEFQLQQIPLSEGKGGNDSAKS